MDYAANIINVINVIAAVGAVAAPPAPAGPPRCPVRRRDRCDPFAVPDREFFERYRFSKASVYHLADILRPHLSSRDNRGLPFTPEEVVCTGLDILGGGQMQRTLGACSRCCTASAHLHLYMYINLMIK